jgi:endonuclease/exonuclease/phosphatase family metal-dependent hydrolase
MSVVVATLNIWNRNDPWADRLAAIRSALGRLSPDVIGLQEVLRAKDAELAPDQATRIADGLGYHVAFAPAWRHGDIELGNAILSRFPILRTARLGLPCAGSDESRCALFAELDAPFGKLPFFVTHLNWRLDHGHVRVAQVRALTDWMAMLASPGTYPEVVVGDFNAEPLSDEIRFMRGYTALGGTSVYFADAFAVAGDGSQGATFCRRNPFAASTHEPDRRIDYVFVRGHDPSGHGAPLQARVCFDEPIDGVFASDHFGVVATLST